MVHNWKSKKTKMTAEQTLKSQSKAALMALRNVTYVGFSNSEIIDTRIRKHLRAYRNAGARVNIHISRLHKDGGRLEQRIMEHYKEKKVRTWRARGLTNVRRSKDRGKPGHAYVIVRVR